MAKVTEASLEPDEIEALRRAIGGDPAVRAAQRLGLDRHTMLRAVAGYGLTSGSKLQLRLAIASAVSGSAQEPQR